MPSSKIRVAVPGTEQVAMPGARILGAPDPNEHIEVGVVLRRRPSSPGAASPEESAQGGTHLLHEEFTSLHGADPEDVSKVEAFAHEHGLDVADVQLAHLSVTLSGTVAAMSSAFGVYLANYQHAEGVHRGHVGPVYVPQDLESVVECVLGLDDRPVVRPHVRRFEDTAGEDGSSAGQLYTPPQLASIYNFPSGATGKGQSIAILEFGGGYEIGVLKSYFENVAKVAMPDMASVSVAGGHNDPDDPGDATQEVYLDTEVVGSIAYGAKLTTYFAPDFSARSLYQAVRQATHDALRNHSVISISWGGPEHGQNLWNPATFQAINRALGDAAALGITVCVSAGDHGSGNGIEDGLAHVEFPASSPWVLACGGTSLVAQGDQIESEITWNSGGGWATGGGVSSVFPHPAYQQEAGVSPSSVNPGHGKGRGLPDVAGNADLTTFVWSPRPGPSGGTSAVAPLWAALIALLNEKTGGRVGFLTPFLYQLRGEGGAFHDITEGDNDTSPQVGGYKAGPGWDACTGWGSPNGEKLLAALLKKP